MVVPQRDRDAVYTYYRDEVAAGRCPARPGEERQCLWGARPGEAGWKLDQPLPDGVKGEALPAAPDRQARRRRPVYQYMRVDNDILIVSLGARSVAAAGADLSRL